MLTNFSKILGEGRFLYAIDIFPAPVYIYSNQTSYLPTPYTIEKEKEELHKETFYLNSYHNNDSYNLIPDFVLLRFKNQHISRLRLDDDFKNHVF